MKIFINKISILLDKNKKQTLFTLLFFSILISVIETVGISAIMPFISIANDFTNIHTNDYYKYFYDLFSFKDDSNFVIAFGICLIVFYILRSIMNMFYFYSIAKFARGMYHVIVCKLFENYLARSYRNFIEHNSSVFSKTIINEALNITNVIYSILIITSEVIIFILIYSVLFYVNYKITLLITILLVVNAIFLILTISKRIKIEGRNREVFQKRFYKIINSTFGNFKMIKLKSNNDEIIKIFAKSSNSFTNSIIKNETLSNYPRLFLEAFAFSIVISIVIYLLFKYDTNTHNFMAIISVFILGLYRLMPSANRIMVSYNSILFNIKALEIVHEDLIYETENLQDDKIDFNYNIKLKKIYFAYEKNKNVLNDISINIAKGDKIAFVGESGSGKSTLIDLLIGLYKPLKGEVYIDDKLLTEYNVKAWRKKIGYIPQSIYLFDGTVAENVAFGEDYDIERVKKSLIQANIFDFLERNFDGIETKVGEAGIKLSGGQKQRIGIARALYCEPDILVLDEATSALDNETEDIIMSQIYSLSKEKTLIIVAHRLNTIKNCDKVVTLSDGNILEINTKDTF